MPSVNTEDPVSKPQRPSPSRNPLNIKTITYACSVPGLSRFTIASIPKDETSQSGIGTQKTPNTALWLRSAMKNICHPCGHGRPSAATYLRQEEFGGGV